MEKGGLAGAFFVGVFEEAVTEVGELLEASDGDGGGRRGFAPGLAAEVEHGADFAEAAAGRDVFADFEFAAGDKEVDDGALAGFEVRFDDEAFGRNVHVGFEFFDIGDEENGVEELVEVGAGFGGDGDHHDVAAPFFGLETVGGEVGHGAGDVGAFAIDFVDGDDDFGVGTLGKFDGLDGLGLDAVIGSDHDDNDISQHGTVLADGGEGLVAWGVEEGDHAAVVFELVSGDVLGDAAGFGVDGFLVEEGVEQGGFAMIDVAHDGDYGRARNGVVAELAAKVLRGLGGGVFALEADVFQAEFVEHNLDGFEVEALVDGGHDAVFEEFADERGHRQPEGLGELVNGDGAGNPDYFFVFVPCVHARSFLLVFRLFYNHWFYFIIF